MPDAPRLLSTHRLRVTLLDVRPPVWRELRVPSEAPLSIVHEVLQAAFGWDNVHLHDWETAGGTYALADEDSWGEDIRDESAFTLLDVAPADTTLLYRYDFGDGWEHLVEVLSVDPFDASVAPLSCLAGSGATPPEDCGGPSGYEHLLDAYGDPDDTEHEEARLLLGDGYDPDGFDRAGVDDRLEMLWRGDEESESLE